MTHRHVEVHLFKCHFVHIYLHMTYTNVILCNIRITTFLTMKLDEECVHPEARCCLSWPGDVFMSQEDMNLSSHTRKSDKEPDKMGYRHSDREVTVSHTPSHIVVDLDVCPTWKSVLQTPTWCGYNTFCCLTPGLLDVLRVISPSFLVSTPHFVDVDLSYDEIKWELKKIPIYECRCEDSLLIRTTLSTMNSLSVMDCW